MARRRLARFAFVIAGLVLAAALHPGRAFAQTADGLFDDQTLHDLRLYMHPRDLEALRAHFDANMYYPVDVVWRGTRVTTAGVRSRGLASRTATKPALLIEFDHYIRDQSFLGLTDLALDNLVTDPSAIREAVSMALFNRMGQPASRESFARMYINDAYQGLYAIVEAVDPRFLARVGLDANGYLFEKTYAGQFHGESRRSLAAYADLFEARTREHESDSVLYGPIRELFEEVNEDVDGVWHGHLSSWLDLEQFMTHVAIETFLAEEDGVLGFAGMANFYLHRPAGGPHRLLPWDKDRAFDRVDFPIFLRGDENELFKRAITLDALRTHYLNVLDACARLAASGWLESEIARLAAVVAPAVRDDPVKPYTNDQHDAAIAFLIQFARQRPAFVLGEVAAARATR